MTGTLHNEYLRSDDVIQCHLVPTVSNQRINIAFCGKCDEEPSSISWIRPIISYKYSIRVKGRGTRGESEEGRRERTNVKTKEEVRERGLTIFRGEFVFVETDFRKCMDDGSTYIAPRVEVNDPSSSLHESL